MTASSSGRVVLLTGAAGALGREVAAAFLAQGDRLVLLDQDAARLAQAFPALATDARHRLVAADVTSPESLAAALAPAFAALGPAEVLVHVAGGFEMGEGVHEISRASWQRMLDLNAWSFVAITSQVVPAMLQAGRGRVLAVSARGGFKGAAAMGAYAAAKSALQRLVESLSAEVRAKGIAVNSVAPSIIDTPANRAAMPEADASKWVPTSELAATLVFLASPGAASIHGQHLTVDGLS